MLLRVDRLNCACWVLTVFVLHRWALQAYFARAEAALLQRAACSQ